MDNKLEIGSKPVVLLNTHLSLVVFTLLASIFHFGCAETDSDFNEEIFHVSDSKAICLPVFHSLSEGNDMQGPDRAAAMRFCSGSPRNYSEGTAIWKACVKMYTAQYYGDQDISFTFHGTWIKWADAVSLGAGPQPTRIALHTTTADLHFSNLEAIWGVNGALCISTPRWGRLYESRYRPDNRLRDCGQDPKDNNIPWSGNPFAGMGINQGLLVTYAQDEKSVIRILGDQSGNFLPDMLRKADTFYSVIGDFLTWGQRHPVYNSCGKDYAEDNHYIEISTWRNCRTGSSTCQYILTSKNLDDATVKDSYYLLPSDIFEKADPSIYSFSRNHYILKDPTTGADALSTWALDLGGRPYRYLTATSNIVDKICKPGSCVRYHIKTEGYVFPNQLTSL